MKKIFFTILLLKIAVALFSSPLHSKLKHNIVVETDCNSSDLRAISILLSNPGINIKAILISDGEIDMKPGKKRIKNLLRGFDADTIPLAFGSEISSDIFLRDILQASGDEITIVCLGPLSNTTRIIQDNPDLNDKIEKIIWYNESAIPLKGFNYEYGRIAADHLLNSGIRIDIISNTDNNKNLILDVDFFNQYRKSNTKLAKTLRNIHSFSLKTEKPWQNDELAALFLSNPELFNIVPLEGKVNVRYNIDYNISAIKEVVSDMVRGYYRSEHFIAFYGFPASREFYVYDVRQILDSAIIRYGQDEWKACVMTDEFHGHLGVFSIVGAKMGIFAREYFGIGTDLLEINSYAGSKEPLSCMNDGLQVSTGATLGQGLIHLVSDPIARPEAVFTYNNHSIQIKLKPEYLKELQAVISEGIKNYGLQDEYYWSLIRQTSIRYWLEWDRKKIFDLVIL